MTFNHLDFLTSRIYGFSVQDQRTCSLFVGTEFGDNDQFTRQSGSNGAIPPMIGSKYSGRIRSAGEAGFGRRLGLGLAGGTGNLACKVRGGYELLCVVGAGNITLSRPLLEL